MVQYSDINSGGQYPVVHLFDQWAAVEGDTLRLVDDGADLYAHTYARVK